MAYRMLARGSPLSPQLAMAVQGKRMECIPGAPNQQGGPMPSPLMGSPGGQSPGMYFSPKVMLLALRRRALNSGLSCRSLSIYVSCVLPFLCVVPYLSEASVVYIYLFYGGSMVCCCWHRAPSHGFSRPLSSKGQSIPIRGSTVPTTTHHASAANNPIADFTRKW